MKRLNLSGYGFAGYFLLSDGNAQKVEADGKVIPITAKDGKVSLTASQDIKNADGTKVLAAAGKSVKYPTAKLMEVTEGWEDVPVTTENTEDAAAAATETEEQKAERLAKEAKKAEHKKLKDALTAAGKAVTGAVLEGGDALAKAAEAYKTAKEALEAWEKENKPAAAVTDAPLTDEQKALKEEYEAQLEVAAAHKAAGAEIGANLKALLEKCTAAGVKVKKTTASTTSTEGGENRAPKLNYEIAQKIRQDYAVGRYKNVDGVLVAVTEGDGSPAAEKVSAIAEKYGVTAGVINCIALYVNYKLRQGDVAHTPLVNAKFPEGAPVVEKAAA